MKVVASHQPNFDPYLGYFAKARLADVFVLSDDVQFIKNGFIHRNKIRAWQNAAGWRWLTVPVRYQSDSLICQVELAQGDWPSKLLNILAYEYGKAPCFSFAFSLMELVARGSLDDGPLAQFIEASLTALFHAVGLSPSLCRASELNYEAAPGDKNGRLIAITRAVGGDAYLAGAEAARTYLEPARFTGAGIRLLALAYDHPAYPQVHGGFAPMMGIIDALMNVGPGVGDLLAERFCQVTPLN